MSMQHNFFEMKIKGVNYIYFFQAPHTYLHIIKNGVTTKSARGSSRINVIFTLQLATRLLSKGVLGGFLKVVVPLSYVIGLIKALILEFPAYFYTKCTNL